MDLGPKIKFYDLYVNNVCISVISGGGYYPMANARDLELILEQAPTKNFFFVSLDSGVKLD
jgi:hypothetical protein